MLKLIVPIYYYALPLTRDFLFKPDTDLGLLVYIYIINYTSNSVLVRNDRLKLV